MVTAEKNTTVMDGDRAIIDQIADGELWEGGGVGGNGMN